MVGSEGCERVHQTDLWRLLDEYFDSFQQLYDERLYDERYQAKYGYWRPIIEQSVVAFLKCGDLQEGFARVRCPDCKHEMFVAFSCKQRCTCPSCHQQRTLLTSLHVAEDVCSPVAHRQVLLNIPERLRVHTRFDRGLLEKLSSCAWSCLKEEVRRLLGRADVVPGMIGAIQTHGQILHWHPHLHVLITCGAWTPEGEFLELPEFDMQRLLVAWQDAVFELYLAEEKIEPAVVENMRTWPHSGFSVDQSVFLPAGDQAGIARLIQYMTVQQRGQMKVVSFIEPPQTDVIEAILKHCGLWDQRLFCLPRRANRTPTGRQSARHLRIRPGFRVLKGGRARLSELETLNLRISSGILSRDQISYQLVHCLEIKFPISLIPWSEHQS